MNSRTISDVSCRKSVYLRTTARSSFAKLAVPILPLFLRQQPPLDLRQQGHRPVAGFGFQLILGDQHQLFVHGGFRDLVPDGDGLVAEIDRVPVPCGVC